MHRIEIGPAVPRRHSRFLRGLGGLIVRVFGWTIDVRLPDEPKLMVIAAPHTSNWDFVFGLAAILRIDVELHWFAKHTIFQGPWGGLFRALGGLPIDRAAAGGVVSQTAKAYAEAPQLVIGLAPEGTRSKVDKWKRGFYRIALEANVPVVLAYIDYARKRVGAGPVFRPTGDWDADMAPVFEFYRGIGARRPEAFAVEAAPAAGAQPPDLP